MSARPNEMIVGCLAATAAVSASSTLARGDLPGMRLVVGFAFTGMGLATVAMFAPDLAAGVAVLILTTSVFVYGGPLMGAVSTFTKPAASATRTTTTPKGTLTV